MPRHLLLVGLRKEEETVTEKRLSLALFTVCAFQHHNHRYKKYRSRVQKQLEMHCAVDESTVPSKEIRSDQRWIELFASYPCQQKNVCYHEQSTSDINVYFTYSFQTLLLSSPKNRVKKRLPTSLSNLH